MKKLINEINSQMVSKGAVRVFWDYDPKTDVYGKCVVFYGHDSMRTTFEKLTDLPDDAKALNVFEYRDIAEICIEQ